MKKEETLEELLEKAKNLRSEIEEDVRCHVPNSKIKLAIIDEIDNREAPPPQYGNMDFPLDGRESFELLMNSDCFNHKISHFVDVMQMVDDISNFCSKNNYSLSYEHPGCVFSYIDFRTGEKVVAENPVGWFWLLKFNKRK